MFDDAGAWTLAAIGAQARDRPGAPAVVDDDGRATFGELWASAGAVAACLADFPGERVAIAAGRGRPFITAALGAWRAGRAYVPLDMMNPTARLRLITDDSRPAVVIVSPETAGIGADLDVAELAVPTSAPAAMSAPSASTPLDQRPAAAPVDLPPAGEGHEDPVAYVMYTSGTTGRPKGVCVGHASLANLCRFMADHYDVGRADRALHVCSVGFDASAMEIWPTLAAGGTVVACSDADRIRPEAAAALAAGEHCTISVYPTGLAAAALAAGVLPPLRFLFFGGDRMVLPAPPPSHPRMVNVYGPTECTVIASTHVLTGGQAGDEPPIGRPIANVRLRLCDPDGHETPHGKAGELYIGGAAVAHGYLNRPDLTAERFVALPGIDGRWYRTGDLARRNDNGDLIFLGRAEGEQLKVRGVRVEAGEIEAALTAHEQVRWAAVTVVDGADAKEVVAVLVTDGEKPSDRALRKHLMARLPAALLPDRFIAVDRLPLTANGKLDRAEVAAVASRPH